MQQELGALHIRDERLDQIMRRAQENIRREQSIPSMRPEMVQMMRAMDVHEIQEIADRLMALASQVPQ